MKTTPTNPHTHIGDTILPRITNNQNPQERDKPRRGDKEQSGRKNVWGEELAPYVGKPVQVLWQDATSVALEWEEPELSYMPEPTASVGYLWEHLPTHVTIVGIVNTNHIAHGLTIPAGCITEINPLT